MNGARDAALVRTGEPDLIAVPRKAEDILSAAVVLIALLPEPGRAGELADGFDFWIGEWEIAQRILGSDGEWVELPARTSVAPALDRRAVVERRDLDADLDDGDAAGIVIRTVTSRAAAG